MQTSYLLLERVIIVLEKRLLEMPRKSPRRNNQRNVKKQRTLSAVMKKEVKNEEEKLDLKDTESETSSSHSDAITLISTTPPKRKGGGIQIMSVNKKTKKNEPVIPKQPLRVEGYAFHDNIIGIVHRKNDGEDAFNGTLRNKVLQEQFHDKDIHAFANIRDKSSGKSDLPLVGEDKFNKIIFLNINTEDFSTAAEAHEHVIDKVTTIHNVSEMSAVLSSHDI